MAAGVRMALRHFVPRLDFGCEPPQAPRFCLGSPSGTATVLEVEIEPEVQAVIEERARLEGSVERLVAHALLVYLTDLESCPAWPKCVAGSPKVGEGNLPFSRIDLIRSFNSAISLDHIDLSDFSRTISRR